MSSFAERFMISGVTLFLALACGGPVHEENFTVAEQVQALEIEIGSGTISVFGLDGTGDGKPWLPAQVAAKVEGDSNHLRRSWSQGNLKLTSDCNSWSSCDIDVRVALPSNAALRLTTGSGDVQVQSAGSAVWIDTGSGEVRGEALLARELIADTGSGDVSLAFATSPERIDVETGSGEVSLRIPGDAYQVMVDTGSGDRSVEGVLVDSAAKRSIAVETGSGDVSIRGY